MILFPTAYKMLTFDPVECLLATCESSHKGMESKEIRLKSDGGAKGPTVNESYVLRFRKPMDAYLGIYDGKTGRQLKEVVVNKGMRTVSDRSLKQRTETPLEDPNDLRGSVYFGQMTLDDLVLAMIDAPSLKRYLDDNFRKREGFKAVRQDGEWWIKTKYAGGSIAMAFTPGQAFISKLKLTSSGGYWNWSMKYMDLPSNPGFTPTGKSILVKDFDTSLRIPKTNSEAATQVVTKIFEAYDDLNELGVKVVSNGKKTTLLLAGGKMRQIDDRMDWSYDGRRLIAIKTDGTPYYSGDVKPNDVTDKLASFGVRVEPTMRPLIMQKNPFRVLLSGADVKLEESMVINGEKTWLLTAKTSDFIYSVAARASDGKVINLAAQPRKSTKGMAVSTQKIITYLPSSTLREANAFVAKGTI